MGGWASAKLLLDLYGHFLPTESTGFADALDVPRRPYTAPTPRGQRAARRAVSKKRARSRASMAPRGGIEPPTRCFEDSDEPSE